jgi:hypothetical protein
MRTSLVLLLLLACPYLFAQKSRAKGVKEEEEYPVKMRIIMGLPLDSILTNPSISPVAAKVINGKKMLSDDKETLAILDSAITAVNETRPLYIHILMYANKTTEGAIADSLGKYNIRLLQKYPKDVLRYFKKGETDLRIADAQEGFEFNIAYELNNQDDPKEAFNELVDKVFEKYKNKDTEVMDKLLKGVKKAMSK